MKTSEIWIMYDTRGDIEALVGDLDFIRNMKNVEKFQEPDMNAITPTGWVKIYNIWYKFTRRTVYHSDDKKENE
jgi:hypothetical protein